MDDAKGSNDRLIWNIYYHLFLDNDSLELLQLQSKKLHTLSASIQSWHDSNYGGFLRFCDHETLTRVREIWNSYNTADLSEGKKASYDKRFKSTIQNAEDARKALLGQGLVLTGLRSAAPLSIQSMEDLPGLFQSFWNHGTTNGDGESLSKSKQSNPMFASLVTDTFTLHYGTDPLLGFHLATAYAPLTSGSPLHPRPLDKTHLHKVVEAARLQFQAWGVSFRRCAGQTLTLRFFAGDAIAFCHTLQHKQTTRDDTSANWYRGPYHLAPLVLSSGDYATTGGAPLSFDVIDTSNLMDHVGAINVLVATSPLLNSTIWATLYAESLVRQEKNTKALIDSLLGGDFPTLSILLGLFPLEYWTNATAISTAEEGMLSSTVQIMGNRNDQKGQMYSRLAWKRPISGSTQASQMTAIPPIHFDEAELSHILHQVYRKMFQHENVSLLFSKLDLQTLQNNSLLHYHRGSMAAFLGFIKKRVVVDWNKVMNTLLDLIANDPNIMMGKNYIQELYIQLHLLGVHSELPLGSLVNRNSGGPALNGLCSWKDIPTAVCITLKVPRAKLGVFTDPPPTQIGTPPVQCVLQSDTWQNIFAAVQLAFGEIATSGSRADSEFNLKITEDRRGWRGSSPLLISFYAPSWVVLLEPQKASLAFGLQSTPDTTRAFFKVLGVDMNVYKTNLGNEDNVYITKYLPNQSGYTSVCNFADANLGTRETSEAAIRTTIRANVDLKTSRIVALTGRLDFMSEEAKSALQDGVQIETIQVSPCIIAIVIGKSGFKYHIHFPAPVLRSRSKSRIARKSSYVEVVAPIAGPGDGETFPDFMYPVFASQQGPVVWNMPRLNLECLPILDMAKTKDMQWLITHTSLMFSSRERTLRNTNFRKDVRLNFKDSLFSMFMCFSGLQGKASPVLGINNRTGGGIHILVFVSCLRLDLGNHTVVLDVALLPLSNQLVPRIPSFLAALSDRGLRTINVDDDELRLWKQVIPAWVERCRQWEHRPSCEYIAKSQIPLSLENGQTPICSCGDGKLPPKFISSVPKWDSVSKHAVRAAISPSFSVPFVEQVFEPKSAEGLGDANRDRCNFCTKDKSGRGTNLLSCARCRKAKYCSVECQRADWKVHKQVCDK